MISSEPTTGPNEAFSKKVFFVGLLSLMIPLLSLATLCLGAILANWRREPGESRLWGGMVIGLATVDSIATTLAALFALGHIAPIEPSPAQAHAEPVGIVCEFREPEGVVVAEVVPSSPADDAGIEPGDRIVAIDGKSVNDLEGLLTALEVGDTAESWSLRLLRESVEWECAVEVDGAAPTQAGSGSSPQIPWSTLPAVLAFLALWKWSRRRAEGATQVLAWLVGMFAVGWAGGWAALVAVESLTGQRSIAGFIFSMFAFSGLPLAVGWIGRSRLEESRIISPSIHPAPARVATTCGLGVLFLIGLGARASWLAFGLGSILSQLGFELQSTNPLQQFAELGLRAENSLALLFTVCIIAPISEEIGLRGILLPWLTRAMHPVAAIASSAAVFALFHPHYGTFVLIPFSYGLVLGWARLRTGGILAPVLLHVAINIVASWPFWSPLVS